MRPIRPELPRLRQREGNATLSSSMLRPLFNPPTAQIGSIDASVRFYASPLAPRRPSALLVRRGPLLCLWNGREARIERMLALEVSACESAARSAS